MTDQDTNARTPSAETRAAEGRDAERAHDAGQYSEQDASAAPGSEVVTDETREHYEDMRRIGAEDRGEGKLP